MAYNALNNLIDAYIYANGVQAITGQILNGVLKQMVSQLGSGYHLMGVAGPETTPASNDYAMAYFAATAGEYTDFGGITLAAGEVAVLLTSGNGSWEKQTIYNVPTTTEDLENTAGFITNAVTDLVNYYTKTEVDTTLADYPTLEGLATTLADYYNKTEIDGQMGDVDTALANRYTKTETDTKLADYYKKTETYDKDEVDSIVAALSRQEYIVAWDGLTAPDVSAIPAGVTVTYSGTTYTGTLAASASTVNKIYMVWNGTAYDMYGTSQDGGYSWVPMGTTTVDLSQYATKAEVSLLEAKVDENYQEHEIEINNINAAVNGSSEIMLDYPEALQFIWLPLPTLQAGNTYTFGMSISSAIAQDLQGNIYKSDKSTVVRYFKISAGDTSNSTTITPDSDVVGGFMRVYSAAVVSNIKISLSCESLLTRVATLMTENATSKTVESKLGTIENWLINADFGFTRVDRYYINGSGTIAYSATFSYTQPMPVSEGDVIVMWRQGIGCAALCSCDSDGTNVKVIKMNEAGDTSDSVPVMFAYKVGVGISYVMLSSKTDAFINHPAFVMKDSAFKNLFLGVETIHSIRTSGQNDKFNNLKLKGGCRYRFKVVDKGVLHLFSIYIKGDSQPQTNIWTNFNDYSYNIWYELIPSGDCEVFIWNQYWGNDINGNPVVDVPIEVEVIFHNYEGEQNELVTKDAIIKEDACANDTSIFSATHILGKLGNLPMYDASCAMANDNDTFIKVFHIDCGRKYFSPTNIKTMISACADNGIQFVQLHMSDNQGLRFVPNDSTFVFNGVEYDLADVAGDGLSIGASVPDGSDKWLNETDMDGILEYARQEGVGIIPSIDMPAHMGTILLLLYPESSAVTTLDIRTNGNTDFALKVAEKYISYFANKGCKYYDFGCDEAKVNGLPFPRETYTNFINTLAHLVVSYDMVPVCYCDAICNKGEKFPYINKGIDVIYWNETLPNVAQPETLKEFGYKMIRSGGNKILYYILGTYTPEEEADFLASLRTRTISESLYRGVMFALWCDNGAADGADDGDAVTAKMVYFIEAFGEVTPV